MRRTSANCNRSAGCVPADDLCCSSGACSKILCFKASQLKSTLLSLVGRFPRGVWPRCATTFSAGAARCVQETRLVALSILKGAVVPAGPVGSVTCAHLTFVGNPGSSSPRHRGLRRPILVLARKPPALLNGPVAADDPYITAFHRGRESALRHEALQRRDAQKTAVNAPQRPLRLPEVSAACQSRLHRDTCVLAIRRSRARQPRCRLCADVPEQGLLRSRCRDMAGRANP